MGNSQNRLDGEADGPDSNSDKSVNFNSFKILRSIGKGSFGKVCMVQKQSNGRLFAMKYLNKVSCIKQNFVENVKREISMLCLLKHDFIVNLWYTFQDEEDFFIVVDLLLGGDLRYHLSKHVLFTEDDVRLYILEMASVLDYLKSKCIIHRDIKPDNILLDDKGHAHLTDFNVATILDSEDELATGFAGTKPYVAPDVCQSKLGKSKGYSFNVDWWSLAITMFELLRHKRPFKISNETTVEETMEIFSEGRVSFSSTWSQALIDLFLKLFVLDGSKRLSTYSDLQNHEFCQDTKLENMKPHFIPSNKHLNYDPTYELEEMMIESKPLHKKKQRIKKQRESKRRETNKPEDPNNKQVDNSNNMNDENHSDLFITFNRDLNDLKPDEDLSKERCQTY
uniref:serine/threonine-protein kinase 32C-like n=1 Tax=Styela clava TaxID=7725 RepID=UPI00193AA954|nr:serine/threonine-protein kinase 32C-like [Styela clava]